MVEPIACVRLCMTAAHLRDRGRLPKDWAVMFRALFDLVADGVVCFAVEPHLDAGAAGAVPVRLRCLLINRAAADLLGWERSRVVGRFASEMPAPFPLAASALYGLATGTAARSRPGSDYPLAPAADGTPVPLPQAIELPLGDRWLSIAAAVNGTMLVATLRDITDSHQAQEQLSSTNERLDAANQLLATANEELRAIADLDGLTQVANRRRFDRYLEECWQRLSRTGGPLSLVMGDIDFFKRYNDTCGHPAGDDCLRQVAEVLTFAARRPTDLVARYGGEEFALILPDTDAAGAADVARNCRELLARLAIVHPDSDVADRVTLSMGIATMVPSAPWACGKIIVEADRALYRAKQAGRDRAIAVTVDS
jgi:diguanylate cyclase (GGDEF)-like protein